jgi:predicted enzyme related to lactoylglutathione lyase
VIGVERTDFVGVLVADLDRALRFYGETLGLRRNPNASQEWPEFETGNLTLSLVRPEQIGREEFTPNTMPIALRVADVSEARARLEAAGVEFKTETMDTEVCHMAVFSDPDGNAYMLHHRYAAYPDGSKP